MNERLALFDLDHTLLPIDSDHAWGDFLCDTGVVERASYQRRNDAFMDQYRAGSLDIDAYLAFALEPLVGLGWHQLLELQHRFMADIIAPQLLPRARTLIQEHRDAGDLCAVVTATNAFVTRPIARALGFEHLVATVPAQRDGRFTGAVRGPPCFQDGKITCVTAWLEGLGLAWESFESTTFYSDSRNDLPLLERVSIPVATNPDAVLLAHAQQQQWRILHLFDD